MVVMTMTMMGMIMITTKNDEVTVIHRAPVMPSAATTTTTTTHREDNTSGHNKDIPAHSSSVEVRIPEPAQVQDRACTQQQAVTSPSSTTKEARADVYEEVEVQEDEEEENERSARREK
jgi:hypothetical protein